MCYDILDNTESAAIWKLPTKALLTLLDFTKFDIRNKPFILKLINITQPTDFIIPTSINQYH